jgi:hypothetical protein
VGQAVPPAVIGQGVLSSHNNLSLTTNDLAIQLSRAVLSPNQEKHQMTFLKALTVTVISACALAAQQIHVTADLLSPQTTTAMFGKLPKTYSAASVSVCNQTNKPQTIALALAAQQTRLSGIVLLPRDAALSVIASSQGSSKSSRILRGSIAAVQLAAIAAGWSTLSTTMKDTLTSAALAGSSAVSILSTSIPTHTYLVFTNEALPDPLQLSALGCATGTVIVETTTSASQVDATVSLPVTPVTP